jgi:hypothetical protein
MLAQEAHKVLLLYQHGLLDDLHVGLGLLQLVDTLQHKIPDLQDSGRGNRAACASVTSVPSVLL